MKWIEDYSVELPVLDEQHKQVFERFVSVKQATARGTGWNDTHVALASLIKRFEFCASVEEALMRIHDYPGGERHKQEHADLLQAFRAMEKASLTAAVTDEMIGSAFTLLMKHHLAQDKRFGRFLPRMRGHAPVACF